MIGFAAFAQKAETFDQAIFRLSGQVYFLSDLKKNQSALKKLSCLKNGSFISSYLNVSLSQLEKMPLYLKEDNGGALKRTDIYPFIYLEKLKNSALGLGRESLTQKDLKTLDQNCRRLNWSKLTIEEKSLFLSEVYLRDRFSGNENLKAAFLEFRKGLDVKDGHEVFKFRPSRQFREELENKQVEPKESPAPAKSPAD